MYATTDEAIFTWMKDDSVIQGLTGADGSDTRVYGNFPEQGVELTSSKPAFLIFSNEQDTPIGASTYGDEELWQVRVFAEDKETRDDIGKRIKKMAESLRYTGEFSFSDGRLQIQGGGFARITGRGFDEDLNTYVCNVRFTLLTILQ